MPQEVIRQSNFTAGELDPAIIARRDLKTYLASCSSLSNAVVMPQGPITRRPGMADIDGVRDPLQAVDASAATFTAANGGDADNARVAGGDALLTTTALGTVNPYVLLEVDFGAPVTVGLVDVNDVDAVTDGGAGAIIPPVTLPWSPFAVQP